MPPVVTPKSLTYHDKQVILAAALKIGTYNIDDVSDTDVYYTVEDPVNTSYRGTYQRSYSITDGKVTLGEPVQVVKRTVYDPVIVVSQFDLDSAAEFSDTGEVLLTGKIFEAGDYPDKDFSISEDELAQAAAEFSPVANDLEHKSTILSGKIGQLRSVTVKGKELFGTVAVPKWLKDAVGNEPIKTSLAWNKANKRIVGNALVLNPRVPDAQLVAAFNAATNNPDKGDSVMKDKKSFLDRLKALFGVQSLPDGTEDLINEVATFDDAPPANPPKPDATPPAPAQPDAQFSERLTAAESANAVLQGKLVEAEAVAFVDGAIKDGRAFPAERNSLIAMFKQAALDDSAGQVCFSDAGDLVEGDRLKLFKQSISARPAVKLTTEQIGDAKELVVLSADTTPPAGMSQERRQQLLAAGEIKVTKEGK